MLPNGPLHQRRRTSDMDEAMVPTIDPRQEPDIVMLHLPFEVVEVGRMDDDVGNKGMGLGCGRAGANLAVAHGGILGRVPARLPGAASYLPTPAAPSRRLSPGRRQTDHSATMSNSRWV